MPHFHYRHVDGIVYDVFIGNGWDNWTRVRVGRDYSQIIGGYRLPAAVLKEVTQVIKG